MNMINAACMFARCLTLRVSEMSLQSNSLSYTSTHVAQTSMQLLQQDMMMWLFIGPLQVALQFV